MKSKMIDSGKILLSFLLVAAMIIPAAFVDSLSVAAETVSQNITDKTKAASGAAVSKTPHIRYYVPYDSWQRDFTMNESDEYFYCTIDSVAAQVYVYDKSTGDFTDYAGLNSSDDKNVNVQFENIDGKTYKNVKISNSSFAGKEIDIRVDKKSGVVYGVSGTADSTLPKFSSALQIKAKTNENSDFSIYDMSEDTDNTRLYTYTFDTASLEMSFLYDGISADSLLTYQIAESENRGISLIKSDGVENCTAAVIDTENCDKITVSVDKYTGEVYASAVKSDIAPEANKVFYLEGRFVCKDSSDNTVSVNNTGWSTSSTNIAFSKTEKDGLYSFATNSTIADLTAPNGSPYYFLVREGTNYPSSATGKYYAPSVNTVLTNTKPGESVAVVSGSSYGGGICFNDKNADSGKVTIWFDNSDPDNPFMYYTLKYHGFSAKAVYNNGTSQYVDYSGSTPSVTPENGVELPSGAAVSAVASVLEKDKEYGFIEWVTENSTGTFENASLPETTFYPSADNETIIARYKVVYKIICEQSEHGTIEPTNEKVGVGEEYTINITPDDGYVLTSLTVNGEEKIKDMTEKTEYTALMPDGSVTVHAVFEEKKDVYFYAAVASNWGLPAKDINVTADGVKLDPVAVFDDERQLYKLNDTNTFSSKKFYVSMFKAEQNSAVIIGEPEHADGSVDDNCYGYKISSGDLQAGACYSYYSYGVGQNVTALIDALNIKSVSCLTSDPKKDSPVDLSVKVENCNGKTAGQEEYTIDYEVTDQKGNKYPVVNDQFIPTLPGKYTVSAWATYGAVAAKSNVAQCEVVIPGDQPVNTELSVEFKFYPRDPDDQTEISDLEQTVAVTQTISESGIAQTVLNAYESVKNKQLQKNMNLMSEYYFYMSQEKALNGIKEQFNYHSPKTDSDGNTIRDAYGIAQYKTYGDCYDESVLKFHTDCYGNVGNSENWVQYFAGDEEISESDAYDNPDSVTKVIVHGFNNPRIYHVEMSFTENADNPSADILDTAKNLYTIKGTSNPVYDVFYNMNLASEADYSESGYLSHFMLSDYYGNENMPTALKSFTDESSKKYIFDGWYDCSAETPIKVSSDQSFTSKVTNNSYFVAAYKPDDSSSVSVASVTVTKNDTEKFVVNNDGNVIEKIKINTVMNAFDCDDISNAAIIYVRLKSTESSDWENHLSEIDIAALKQSIEDLLKSDSAIIGRNIEIVTVRTDDKAQIVADNYEVVSDETSVDIANYKIMLNNKNRVQFSNSFTVESACGNGANAAILTFAAVENGGKWIISDNYIPYINIGE